jgi:hypothetical protein
MTSQWLYNAKFTKLLQYRIYIKLYKIVESNLSWPVVVSELCVNNIKMADVSRKD